MKLIPRNEHKNNYNEFLEIVGIRSTSTRTRTQHSKKGSWFLQKNLENAKCKMRGAKCKIESNQSSHPVPKFSSISFGL